MYVHVNSVSASINQIMVKRYASTVGKCRGFLSLVYMHFCVHFLPISFRLTVFAYLNYIPWLFCFPARGVVSSSLVLVSRAPLGTARWLSRATVPSLSTWDVSSQQDICNWWYKLYQWLKASYGLFLFVWYIL